MADSPQLNTSQVLKLTIRSGGTAVPDTLRVISVEISKAVNRISSARIAILDGDMPHDDFPASNLEAFAPGKELVISAGYGSQEEQIFDGIIVRHGIKIGGKNEARLVLECKHAAVSLTIGRNNANYVDLKDSEIISQLISPCGASAKVTATTTKHKEIVQYYSSDWDFLVARAEANGMLVIPDDGSVLVDAPQTDKAAVLKVTYGVDLMSFQADIDARTQLQSVKGAAWDPATQTVVEQTASPLDLYKQGNLDAATLAKVAGPSSYRLQTTVSLESDEIKAWASARQMKAALARIRGKMKFQGSAKAKPGKMIELVGVGKRFSGSVFVSAVNHEIVNGNWITEVEFGMAPEWFSEQNNGIDAPASGLLPGVAGLQIGVVKKLDADPEGQYKIQVAISVLQAETEGVWARLASFYGSSGVGAFFIPEIDDEVVIGYFNNDPSHPVVLGSLYSSKRKMPYELTAENYTKALWTKGLLKVIFDDEKKVITIITPEKNSIVLSDDAKSICLTDQNSNKIEMNPDGILLDSPKDIVINAKGKISISAVANIESSAKADIKSEALNINNTAKVGFVAKGSATAELSASGQTTVKGAMVMIN
ncbi:Rhs element Vgr protein [Herbaspirillum sp. CF444]|uniref:type VI secretion system tip protein VgrG n=1 Tax=Herbaspirillum sp. CF444 TaxID=1144319 RepID=UPI0002724BD2|nr:type VI secretion system tip protein VgrG [Herbaspirillum sp. CF444]EJL89764.1 Rhs element Vgr protein [Herbaspirillum sp. CF444]